MRRTLFFASLICTILLTANCSAEPLSTERKTAYLPNIPPISLTTVTSRFISMRPYKKSLFRIFIPIKDVINLAITRNKNSVLSELIPGKYLSHFFFTKSNNNFEQYPVDAQIIINGNIQSIKIVAFNFSPKGTELIAKPFVKSRNLKKAQGPGTLVVSSACIKNRITCILGCVYLIVPEPECRKKLGIL